MATLHSLIKHRTEFIQGLLKKLSVQHRADTIFLFGGEGDPFWVSKKPVSEEDLHIFSIALDHIIDTEKQKPKPFFGFDEDGRYSFKALPEHTDLYVVVVTGRTGRVAQENCLTLIGEDIVRGIDEHLNPRREMVGIKK